MSSSLLNLLILFLIYFVLFNGPPQVSFSQFNSVPLNIYASLFYKKNLHLVQAGLIFILNH